MKTFLTTAAAFILGLTAQAVAMASDGHGHAGHQSNHTSIQNHGPVHVANSGNGTGNSIVVHNKTDITSIHTGATFNKIGGNVSGKNFTGTGKYTAFKDYKGPCYYGKHCNFWSKSCFNDHFGCYTYWCPRSFCWFYWCQPYGCYLPVEYCPTGCYVY
jgi:hypothetical protein